MMPGTGRDHGLDHVVVLMFENRSFDHLLGYLYRPGEVPAFEGVVGRELSNPIPSDVPGAGRNVVPVHPAANMNTPDPDPGEEHPHTNTQLYGTVAPPENRLAKGDAMKSPFNAPDDPSQPPTMSGFVTDYVNAFRVEMERWPNYDEYAQIMACYTPEQLPVLSALAKGFACFDHWFCEVPTQTYANRSFFHAASSSGYVLNAPPGKFSFRNDAPTIFERLEAAKLPWKVYIDPEQILSATGLIHARRLSPYFATRFSTIFDFYDDARRGTLPAYSFLEPNMFHPHTDMHPPGGGRIRRELHVPAAGSILGGERLLARVYDSIRASSTPDGSNWRNTLLLVTFDEHGGTYDHVPPPAVPPPDPSVPEGEEGFRFDRSGVRIPTVAISAWIDPGTVVTEEYRSTSVIRTLREHWNLGAPLTHRDAVAADLSLVLRRETPRPAEDWPRVVPPPSGILERIAAEFDRLPLERLERDLVGEARALEARATGEGPPTDIETMSHREADHHSRRIGTTMFPRVVGGRRS
ncbi:MAG: alkaline phosphatase family protein [Thermoplasmata archaeon]|jgi:phospholipase C